MVKDVVIMEPSTDLDDNTWHEETKRAVEEIRSVSKKIFIVVRQASTNDPFKDSKYSSLYALLAKFIDSHVELCSHSFEYDPKKAAASKATLLANLRKQVLILNKLLRRLHNTLASLETKRLATPVANSKIFIEDNKLPAPSDEELKRTRLPISIAEDVANILDLTDKEMATILTISIRTYHRLKLNGLLNPVASERLLLLKEIAVYGLEVFEDQSNFNQWLRLPLRELSNISPLNSLDTATGFNRVKTVLERIEYGVYS